MDHERFDWLVRSLAARTSRRSALAALLGTGLAGAAGLAEARNRGGSKKRKAKQGKRKQTGRGPAEITAQAADCASLRPGSNLNGCDFSGDDLSGLDLYGSSMRGTNFAGATLVGANLSSSTLTGADFSGANLCGADLRSSQLRNADFTDANLTNADLASSGGCNTIVTNEATVFCNTRLCNGRIRTDDGCPDDPCCTEGGCCTPQCAGKACGADDGCDGRCQTGTCPNNQTCQAGTCGCADGFELVSGTCFRLCDSNNICPAACYSCNLYCGACAAFLGSNNLCIGPSIGACGAGGSCPPGTACYGYLNQCVPPC